MAAIELGVSREMSYADTMDRTKLDRERGKLWLTGAEHRATPVAAISFTACTLCASHVRHRFWKRGMKYRSNPCLSLEERRAEAWNIYKCFLSESSPDQVSQSGVCRHVEHVVFLTRAIWSLPWKLRHRLHLGSITNELRKSGIPEMAHLENPETVATLVECNSRDVMFIHLIKWRRSSATMSFVFPEFDCARRLSRT